MTAVVARPAWLKPPHPQALMLAAGVAAAILGAIVVARLAGAEMSNGETVIIALRLFVPLIILRWWVVGGIVAMLLDASDVIIIEPLGMGGFGDHYAQLDKVLDLWYLGLELWVACWWRSPWAKWTAIGLFAYRVVGVILFEAIGARVILFTFPNLFENWWLYCVMVMKWKPSLTPSNAKNTLIPMVLLLVPKMPQEYLLHYTEAKPWNWTKGHILEPLGLWG
ncbi:MAG: hypothetical protein AB7T37_03025 [Dehalococcoidia bacterium]